MKITQVTGREIFDSRGIPTVECEIELDNFFSVRASVPSGLSCGAYEAKELRDGGKRLMGNGVQKAIDSIERIIAPMLIGKEPQAVETDLILISLDETQNKSKLGANTLLAVSGAMYRAQAHMEEMHLFELIAHLCDFDSVNLPRPFFNIINGGVHADNNLSIQEFMVVPVGARDFRSSMESVTILFYTLKTLLQEHNKSTLVGDEGGFASDFATETEPLDFLVEAINRTTQEFGYDKNYFAIALDVAATELYDEKSQTYILGDKKFSSAQLIDWYVSLVDAYPICSIEDGLGQDDWEGWIALTDVLGERVQLVGDDIFVTHKNRIIKGMELGVANTVLIKPNQVGTVTEAIQAIRLCQENEYNVMVSHRSGETEDTFITDLAVGVHAGQIKAGGCSRGERVAKYNQLLRIEDELTGSLLNS